jgi:hypothetical protein
MKTHEELFMVQWGRDAREKIVTTCIVKGTQQPPQPTNGG